MNEVTTPTLVGHRGEMTRWPENSWRALRAALDAGACWVEFDVQMCRDGTFVLLHDTDLLRTGNDSRCVFEHDYETLRDASVHQPERFGQRFLPTPLARLDEVLQSLEGYRNLRAMIEIKRECLQYFGLQAVMDRLLELLAHHQRHVLISFDADAIEYSRRLSSLQTGWVLRRYDETYHRRAIDLQPDYLICNHSKLPPGEEPWKGSWTWMLYDICDPSLALQWARAGVGLIETGDITRMLDHPELASAACAHGL